MRKNLKKISSLLLVVAMLCSLMVTGAFAANAATGYWTDEGNYSTDWYKNYTGTGPYEISTAADLAGLAVLVKDGVSFADKTISVTANIDLSAHYWVPIGGNGTYTGSMPGGNSFQGTFDGSYTTDKNAELGTAEITGMTIDWSKGMTLPNGNTISTGSYAGAGLFGYVVGGVIKNITVCGSIVTDAAVYCVGGVAGYMRGSIYNCHNKVDITITNTTPSQCGGIVGTLESLETSADAAYYVQYCSNTAAIQGRGRVGGIVGAVYCNLAGGVVVDQCYNTGNITTYSSASKAYAGGIVGYCRGYIQNCYSIATMTANGGHYLAGIVGLLQGSGPQAKLSNSYTVPVFKNAATNYDRWVFGTVDSSSTLPITDVLWCETANGDAGGTSNITQPIATTSNNWGKWTNTGSVSEDALKENKEVTLNNTGSAASTMTVSDVLGSAFYVGTAYTSQNGGYPVLTWQNDGVKTSDFSGSGGSGTEAKTVYLDGTKPTDGDGTDSAPYNNLTSAITGAGTDGTILVSGTVTLSTGTYADTTVSILPASDFTGTMFTVTGTVALSGLTIDGAGADTDGTIIQVASGGSLTLTGGVTLRNSYTAVDVLAGGALTVDSADITVRGYSVTVADSTSTFELAPTDGTSITGTVYLGSGAKITLNANLTETLYVTSVVTTSGTVIAECASGAIARSNFELIIANGAACDYDNNEIFIV